MTSPVISASHLFRFARRAAAPVAAASALAAASCSPPPTEAAPPPVPITDTRPVGEGLKVIGYALLGAAVLGVLGRIIR